MMRLLVTGTTGGIGGAVASLATAQGNEVVAVNRDDWPLLSTALGTHPFEAVVFATGMCPIVPLRALTDELWLQTMQVNCGLFLRLMRHLVGAQLYAPSGMRVVAISSVSATEGWAGGAAYCASKGALSALCRALDSELAPRHIRVEALEPRYVLTSMFTRGAGRLGVPSSAAQKPMEFAQEIMARLENKERS